MDEYSELQRRKSAVLEKRSRLAAAVDPMSASQHLPQTLGVGGAVSRGKYSKQERKGAKVWACHVCTDLKVRGEDETCTKSSG